MWERSHLHCNYRDSSENLSEANSWGGCSVVRAVQCCTGPSGCASGQQVSRINRLVRGLSGQPSVVLMLVRRVS